MLGAMLLHSVFSNSSFRNVNLSNAIVNDNDFSNCNFCGANAECDGFETCKLNNVIYNKYTRWKEGFIPDKYGAKFVE